MNSYCDTAIKAVEAAAKICRRIQLQLISDDSIIKKDRSPVTIADYAAQAMICKILKEEFPQIPIVAEEESGNLKDSANRTKLDKIAQFLPGWSKNDIIENIDHGAGSPAELFWTLDPIDGTKGFLRKEQYAVALALIQNGKIIAGVLGCPNLSFGNDHSGTIMYASCGEGAYARSLSAGKPEKVRVSLNTTDGDVRFLESVEAAHSNHGLQSSVMKRFGEKAKSVRYDSQVKYAVLAQGLADVYLRLPNPASPDYREKIWDHAAGAAIVTEAGGKVTDMTGKELDFSAGRTLLNNRGLIVSNNLLHEEIIKLINA